MSVGSVCPHLWTAGPAVWTAGGASPGVRIAVIPLCEAVDAARAASMPVTCDDGIASTVHRPYYFPFKRSLGKKSKGKVALP